jgi:hypothetical protein
MKLLLRLLASLCFVYCIFAVMLRLILPCWLDLLQGLEGHSPEGASTALRLAHNKNHTETTVGYAAEPRNPDAVSPREVENSS